MRIAQVAPLAEAVPPKLYGGTERVVSWLTEALVEAGHDVTLFASGDSETSARLVACSESGLRLAGFRDHLAATLVMLDEVRRREAEFDVIHFHTDLAQFALFKDIAHKCVTTLHGRLDLPDYMPVFRHFREMPLVSISDDQRRPLPPDTNWAGTVHHGLPAQNCPFSPRGGQYLAFLGRISPEKRPDRAIEIAVRAGLPLKMAAKVDKADQDYFEEVIEPLLAHPLVEFVGEINEEEKSDFLGNALALLFPIDWCEPFGLVMIEAMSAGTPVIAWNMGSVPEVVTHGESGYVVASIEEAVAAVEKAKHLERTRVRRTFESRFTARRMAEDYVDLYESLVKPLALPAVKVAATRPLLGTAPATWGTTATPIAAKPIAAAGKPLGTPIRTNGGGLYRA
ncbi:glycosyltransferase family 4 protein [Prosthecomicrobium sp. N25]|uniref:glycosyltransferase family 4 protein n=1 Tax=Prosthecomicrobium sp. N25 TaxID=3129254 RepID=UPI00307801BA